MACGRRKNLEIAAQNLLCSPGDRRRNFPTTRDGNRRRGNPSHPAKDNSGLSGKEKSGATGKEETPRHRCGGNPGPLGVGQTLGPLVSGKARCHSGERGTRKGEPRASGAGKTSRYAAEGKPRVACGEESSGPSAKGKLQVARRRGNPESRNEKKALS